MIYIDFDVWERPLNLITNSLNASEATQKDMGKWWQESP